MTQQVRLIKHSEVEADTECDGNLVSQYLNNTKCSECDALLRPSVIADAMEKIEDHQTFYGLAVVLIDESEVPDMMDPGNTIMEHKTTTDRDVSRALNEGL